MYPLWTLMMTQWILLIPYWYNNQPYEPQKSCIFPTIRVCILFISLISCCTKWSDFQWTFLLTSKYFLVPVDCIMNSFNVTMNSIVIARWYNSYSQGTLVMHVPNWFNSNNKHMFHVNNYEPQWHILMNSWYIKIYLNKPNNISINPYYPNINHNNPTFYLLDTTITPKMLLVIPKLPLETSLVMHINLRNHTQPCNP